MSLPIIIAIACGAGLALGILIMILVNLTRQGGSRRIAAELFERMENDRIRELEAVIARLKESFAALSYEALHQNSEQFLKIADGALKNQTQLGAETLENKKRLIDQTLVAMHQQMEKVEAMIRQLEKDREQKFGEVSQQLKATVAQTARLSDTTSQLNAALSNTRVRGQWGERMAEDVLRLSGLLAGVNYAKQTVTGSGSRPDFTFFLPQGLKVNMDVKFPLDNYLNYLRAEDETQRSAFKMQFLKDVKNRLKEVTTRDYIDPAAHTVDYVLVFIPNEQVFGFLYEASATIFEDALQSKVVMCSPLTLYAFLVVIRQAAENYNLEKTAGEVITLLIHFRKQWDAFCLSLDKVGKRLEEARSEYLTLVSTRRSQLEKPLRAIDGLRREKGFFEPEPAELSSAPENEAAATGPECFPPDERL